MIRSLRCVPIETNTHSDKQKIHQHTCTQCSEQWALHTMLTQHENTHRTNVHVRRATRHIK